MLYTLNCHLIAVAAGANEDTCVSIPAKSRIVSAVFSPIAASAANATDYATLTLSANNGAGGGFSAIAAAMTTATVAMAIGTNRSFTISPGSEIQPAGACIKLAKTYAASGVAVEGVLTLLLEKVA